MKQMVRITHNLAFMNTCLNTFDPSKINATKGVDGWGT